MTPLDSSYRTIDLHRDGLFATVDATDYEWLNGHKWFAVRFTKSQVFYAFRMNGIRGKGRKSIYMAREILGLKTGDTHQADHINHDTLDNRRCNLRVATAFQQSTNKRVRVDSGSGIKGVRWHKRDKAWQARIQIGGKSISLGYFRDEWAAKRAYNEAARLAFGEYRHE